MTTTYDRWIARKAARHHRSQGIDVRPGDLHERLYPFQREIVSRALEIGSPALFEDCGMGKTIQELEWARWVNRDTAMPVLILTPLAVGPQMVAEAEVIGVDARLMRRGSDDVGEVGIANYEMLGHFDPARFGGLVLDESSILKAQRGATRTAIIDFASRIPYRMAATATPAPNDLIEILNHAAYLGVMSVEEALGLWFVHDGNDTSKWRLKGHAVADFWRWCATWAIVARSPGDIGLPQPGYDLPALRYVDHEVDYTGGSPDGMLFDMVAGISDLRRVRRATVDVRSSECAAIVNASDEPWVVWCELNSESAALAAAIPDAVEVRGSETVEAKTRKLTDFADGRVRVIVTKPSIAGHGLNWQHCSRMAFVGPSYSYESHYQAVRRCWRYGQTAEVEVHRMFTAADRTVNDVMDAKASAHDTLYDSIPWQMHRAQDGVGGPPAPSEATKEGTGYTLYLGDSVHTIDHLETGSVGLSVFSPPFPGMYVYTDSPHDMGNVQSIAEMVEQFGYLMGEDKMRRVVMPGRSVFVHITQGVAQVGRDGYMGLKDFRGDIIRMMEGHGWHYYGEVTIDKNPQVKAMRTHDQGLSFTSLRADAARMHPAMADTLLQFRAPGINPVPIQHVSGYGNMDRNDVVTNDDWILWARPVWYAQDYQPPGSEGVPGIAETDVLPVSPARSANDERHVCPLQLEVIRRCVRVWSAPGDLVYSPFAGIGSEGVVSLREGRRFVGGELKREYWTYACRNLLEASAQLALAI